MTRRIVAGVLLLALIVAAGVRQYGDMSVAIGHYLNVREDNYKGIPLYCRQCGSYDVLVMLYPRPRHYCPKCKRTHYAD